DPAPQRCEPLIITSVAANVAASIMERISAPVWWTLDALLEEVSDGVWGRVGLLIEHAALEHLGDRPSRRDADAVVQDKRIIGPALPISLWMAVGSSMEEAAITGSRPATYYERTRRVSDGVQAYHNAAWLALALSV